MRQPGYPAYGDIMSDRLAQRRRVFEIYGISGSKGLARTMAEELRATVMGCMECREIPACADWAASATASDPPPGFCPAREALEKLRRAV